MAGACGNRTHLRPSSGLTLILKTRQATRPNPPPCSGTCRHTTRVGSIRDRWQCVKTRGFDVDKRLPNPIARCWWIGNRSPGKLEC